MWVGLHLIKRASALLCVILALQLICPPWLLAQIASGTTAPSHSPVTAVTPLAAGNLDLTSTERTFAAPAKLGTSSVNIQVGGAAMPLSATSLLTPAEYVAVNQMLYRGAQSLVLGGNGSAVGGTFYIPPSLSRQLTGLTVASGVTAMQNFAKTNSLNLSGNFNNFGNYYAFSTNPQTSTATINAGNIFNASGALLSTLSPSGGFPGLSGNVVNNSNLSLNAVQNIINQGTISSAGNLNMAAGGYIANTSAPVGPAASPILQAMNNLSLQAASITNQGQMMTQFGNLNAATANLINSGLIQATNASVSIQSLLGNQLLVDSTRGQILARDSILLQALADTTAGAGTTKGRLQLTGDSLSAAEVNFNSPLGEIDINADRMDGLVNLHACDAHITQKFGNLNIGAFDVSGDPVIYLLSGGFSYTGNIVTHGNILTISAPSGTGSINITGSINTSPLTTNGPGGDVLLLAGDKISVGGTIWTSGVNDKGGNVVVLTNYATNTSGGAAISLSDINTQGTSGGDVVLVNTNNVGIIATGNINTSSSASTGHAGAVGIVGPQTISVGANNLSSPVINTSGVGGGQSGGVFISSGSASTGGAGSGITLGGATNASPLNTGADGPAVLQSHGDIQLGSSAGYVQYSSEAHPTSILGIFPEISTYHGEGSPPVNEFLGFPSSADSNNYTFHITPSTAPWFTDNGGGNHWNYVPGGFTSMAQFGSGKTNILNTTGNLTVETGGSSRLIVPLVFPNLVVQGNVVGDNTTGSASSVALVAHQTITLASASSAKVVDTRAKAGVAGATPGDLIVISGAGASAILGVTVGPSGGTTNNLLTGDPANSVSAPGGVLLVGSEVGPIFLNGNIVTSGTGSFDSGSVTLVAALTKAAGSESTILSVGDVTTSGTAVGGISGNGGAVGLYSGSDLSVGNITTSAFGAAAKAGSIILAADNTQWYSATPPTSIGILTAKNLVAAGQNNASGGSITLDSGSQVFTLGTLITRSASDTNFGSWTNNTGSGSAGDLLFTNNALSWQRDTNFVALPVPISSHASTGITETGSIIITPNVTLTNGSSILLDGARSDMTSSIELALVSTTSLGDLSTKNSGSGAAGWVTITPATAGLTINNIVTSSAANNAGNIYIKNTGTSALTIANHIEAVGSGANNYGGAVFLGNSNGVLNIGTINTQGLSGAFGGMVYLVTSSSANNIVVGSSSADSLGVTGIDSAGIAGGGKVTLVSGGAIKGGSGNLDIDASSGDLVNPTGAKGGAITLVSNGNDGTNSISVNNLKSFGLSGGTVQIASLDSAAKPVITNGIDTHANGATQDGAAVSVSVLGNLTISGTINTTNANAAASGAARSGSVFLSSGSASGTSIQHNSIIAYNNNGSATGNVIRISAGGISGPTPTVQNLATNSGLFQNFSTATTTLGSSTTNSFTDVAITPTSVSSNYNPAGYSSGATPLSFSNNSTLRINTGGDNSIIAPLIVRGNAQTDHVIALNTGNADSLSFVVTGNFATQTTSFNLTATGTNRGGAVNILSTNGTISLGYIDVSATQTGSTVGGNINLLAPSLGGTITDNNSTSTMFSGTALNTSGNSRSGYVNLLAGSTINSNSRIMTLSAGSAGDVDMTSFNGNIIFQGYGGINGFLDYLEAKGGT